MRGECTIVLSMYLSGRGREIKEKYSDRRDISFGRRRKREGGEKEDDR
jgi:hypothetical protein